MKRTDAEPPAQDWSALIRALLYLDECLKRGVVIGVYEDSLEVSDEDIRKALVNVNALLVETRNQLDMISRSHARLSSLRLQ